MGSVYQTCMNILAKLNHPWTGKRHAQLLSDHFQPYMHFTYPNDNGVSKMIMLRVTGPILFAIYLRSIQDNLGTWFDHLDRRHKSLWGTYHNNLTISCYTYVVCSKSIANFEFLRVTYIRFSIFCGVMLVLICLVLPTSSAILNVQLIFTAILFERVLARLRFLPIPKSISKNLYQLLCEKQN